MYYDHDCTAAATQQVAALTDKPLCVAEMATMSCYKDECVDKPLWLTEG
jgi:hypothetical protein